MISKNEQPRNHFTGERKRDGGEREKESFIFGLSVGDK
jgi:hypothetical protein